MSTLSKIIKLNKNNFLQILEELKLSLNITDLKNNITQLITNLSDTDNNSLFLPNSLNIESIEINQDYLTKELLQIKDAQTLDRAIYYIKRLEKAVTSIKTSDINDININRWKEYDEILTDSLWIIDRRDSSGVHSAGYWGNFIPQIPNQMMKRYTKKGDWVLDTFLGCGTTLIEAQRLGRNCIGVELQANIVEKATNFINSEPNNHLTTWKILNQDSAAIDYNCILKQLGINSVQLVIMHPPYFDIIKFSEDPKDLSNANSVSNFLVMLKNVAANAASILDKGRYLVLVIGDKYVDGDWIPLGFLAMNEILNLGFSLKSIVVKNFEDTTGKRNQKDLWRYRALVGGFYIFKHEYIFILKRK
ncbi:MAG: DNA methyltransferase [Blastocatellia bacterium]|nr:DNA methyltransferase [Blastocatellia bacterium]